MFYKITTKQTIIKAKHQSVYFGFIESYFGGVRLLFARSNALHYDIQLLSRLVNLLFIIIIISLYGIRMTKNQKQYFVHVIDDCFATFDVLQSKLRLHSLFQYISFTTNKVFCFRRDTIVYYYSYSKLPWSQSIQSSRQCVLCLCHRLLYPTKWDFWNTNKLFIQFFTCSPTNCSCASAKD